MALKKFITDLSDKRKAAARRKKKDAARLRNYDSLLLSFFDKRDQMAALEKKLLDAEKVAEAAHEVVEANQELQETYATLTYLKLIGQGSRFGLDEGEKAALDYLIENSNLDTTIPRMLEEKDREISSANEKLRAYEKGHLVSTVAAACHAANLDRVPVMLYDDGKIIYKSEKVENMIGSHYRLEQELGENPDVAQALRKSKKIDVPYEDGTLHFIPEKMKSGNVAIAYFVPEGDKKQTRIFRRYGERAVSTIYKTLKGLERVGIGIDYGKDGD